MNKPIIHELSGLFILLACFLFAKPVAAQIPKMDTIRLAACLGEVVVYEGIMIPAGETVVLPYVDEHGADSIIVVEVTAHSLPIPEVDFTATCLQKATGMAAITGVTGGQAPYEYSMDGLGFSSIGLFTELSLGKHTLLVHDANGCQSSLQFSLPVLPQLITVIDTLQILPCNPPELVLEPTVFSGDFGNLTYAWMTGETTPAITVRTPGEYSVEVSNHCESRQHHVRVLSGLPPGSNIFYAPNAFSPNSDGVNDRFRIWPAEAVIVESFRFDVFNRWGSLVFSTTDINTGWDGQDRERLLRAGVYLWRLESRLRLCGELQELDMKGEVELMR